MKTNQIEITTEETRASEAKESSNKAVGMKKRVWKYVMGFFKTGVKVCKCKVKKVECFYGGSDESDRLHKVNNIIYLLSVAAATIEKSSKHCKRCKFVDVVHPVSRLQKLSTEALGSLEKELKEIIKNHKDFKNCLSDRKRLGLLVSAVLSGAYAIGKKDEARKRAFALLGSGILCSIYSYTTYLHMSNPSNDEINQAIEKNMAMYKGSSLETLSPYCTKKTHVAMGCELANKIVEAAQKKTI